MFISIFLLIISSIFRYRYRGRKNNIIFAIKLRGFIAGLLLFSTMMVVSGYKLLNEKQNTINQSIYI